MDLPTVLLSGVVSLTISGLIKWRADHNIKSLKGQIQRTVDRDKQTLELEMKPLHAQVERIEFEHQTRFTKLHEKRIDVIVGLYQRLVKVEGLLSPWPAYRNYGPKDLPANEFGDNATQDDDDFWMYYQQNKFWFDSSLCDDIEEVHPAIVKAIMVKIGYLRALEDDTDDDQNRQRQSNAFGAVQAELKKVRDIRDEIIGRLRETLGVEDRHALQPFTWEDE